MELRLPAPLRRGVDGHVRPVTTAAAWRRTRRGGRHRRRRRRVAGRMAGRRDVAHRGLRGDDLARRRGAAPSLRPAAAVQAGAGRARGRPRRRCWPTSGARASCGCTRCWAAAPSRLDVEGRKVELDDGAVLDGDAIVIATGAAPRRLPGTEDLSQRDGLFTLRTLDDSLALRAAVTAVEAAAGRRDRRRASSVPRSPRPVPAWGAG